MVAFYYLDIVRWLSLIKPLKKMFQKSYDKRGIKDIDEYVKERYINKISKSALAAGWMEGLIGMFEIGVFNIIQAQLNRPLWPHIFTNAIYLILFILLLLTTSLYLNYLFLYKDNKYKRYFKEFEKMSERVKRIYGWKCFLIVLTFTAFFISSFFIMLGRFGS